MPPRPTVAFVDDETWLSFVDLAAGLRSRGVRVVRVTARMPTFEGRLVQRLEGLAFGRTRVGAVDRLTGRINLGALDAALSDDVIDVVVQDPLVPELLGPGQSRADQRSRVRAGVDPRVLVDKRVQSQVAASAGVAVPREWTEPVSSQFPVVVKLPVGSSGAGVRIVADAEALESAWTELSSAGRDSPYLQEPYVQEYVEGRLVSFGGVVDEGQVLVGATYVRIPPADDPTGPSEAITVIDAPLVTEAALRFASATGLSGFLNLQFVDSDRGPLLIDVNPRVFGSWSILQDLGCDLLGAYLAALGLGTMPPRVHLIPGEPVNQIHLAVPAGRQARRVWRRRVGAVARRRSAWLGWRWRLLISCKVALLSVRASVRG